MFKTHIKSVIISVDLKRSSNLYDYMTGDTEVVKKLILLVVLAALVLAGLEACKRYPKMGKAVDNATKDTRTYCKNNWKITSTFLKNSFSKSSMDKKWKSVKAPFLRVKKRAERKPLPTAESSPPDNGAGNTVAAASI